jgi:hypothetical protein
VAEQDVEIALKNNTIAITTKVFWLLYTWMFI